MKRKIEPGFEVASALQTLGASLRTARLRRSETIAMLAQRLGTGRETIARLERGDGGVSTALLFEALTHYGFADQLYQLADPEQDAVGKRLDALRRPRRGSRGGSRGTPPTRPHLDPSQL